MNLLWKGTQQQDPGHILVLVDVDERFLKFLVTYILRKYVGLHPKPKALHLFSGPPLI